METKAHRCGIRSVIDQIEPAFELGHEPTDPLRTQDSSDSHELIFAFSRAGKVVPPGGSRSLFLLV